jgi:hypothetical protein
LNQGTGADDDIIQPGLLDRGLCTASLGNQATPVATLSNYVEILFGKGPNKPSNYVDAAIAAVVNGAVVANGSILGIGTLSGMAVYDDQALGLAVQKTGRTSGHTFGTVLATDVEIDVKYESGTARFVNQLRIRHACDGMDFSDNGDSGSQIVTAPDVGDPDSVGLLFAGGDADTFANPMLSSDPVFEPGVLDELGVAVVGGNDGVDNEGAMLSDYPTAEFCAAAGGGGGGGGGPGGGGPGGGPGGGGPPFGSIDPAGLAIASDVKARNSDAIFSLPDVVGHGLGFDDDGDAVIEIYVASKARREAGRPLPTDIEGVSVRVVETGVIQAF